jgi:hypothetical protein
MDAAVTHTPAMPGRLGLWLRWSARGILIAIAGFWVWFGIADGLHDAQTLGPMGFIMMLPAALIVLGVLYLAWRWELAGGIMLVALSGLGAMMFIENLQRMHKHGAQSGLGETVALLCVFILPFLIPAVLLLLKCWLDRRSASTE